jgi:flagellar hook-associated protein 2
VVVDASQISGLSLQQVAVGQNALLSLSGTTSASGGVIVSSATNSFTGVLQGVTLQAQSATNQPVTIEISSSDSQLASSLQQFVTNYNQFRTTLSTDTTYTAATNTGSVLFGDYSALELDTQLSQAINGTFGSGTGTVKTLADVGITVNSDGTLAFTQGTLDSAWAANSSDVKQFFTAKNTGLSDSFNTLITQLAGQGTSALSDRITALKTQITDNQQQITQMNTRLTNETNLLYQQYYNMDLAIGQFKQEGTVISSLSSLDPYTGSNSNSSTTTTG